MPRSFCALRESAWRLRKAIPVADFLRARHMRGELAGVVDLLGRRRVGHLLRLDEVLLAQRVGTDAEFARRDIDQPLDQIGRLRPAGAAIGIDRQRVGEGRAHPRMSRPENRTRPAASRRRHRECTARRPTDSRPCRRRCRRAEPRNLLFVVERQFGGRDVVAALRIAEEMLGAVGDPFHRTLEPLRRDSRKRIFAERKQLGAEAAAGIGRDDPHLLRRDVENHLAQNIADAVRPLAAERERADGPWPSSYSATTARVSR